MDVSLLSRMRVITEEFQRAWAAYWQHPSHDRMERLNEAERKVIEIKQELDNLTTTIN